MGVTVHPGRLGCAAIPGMVVSPHRAPSSAGRRLRSTCPMRARNIAGSSAGRRRVGEVSQRAFEEARGRPGLVSWCSLPLPRRRCLLRPVACRSGGGRQVRRCSRRVPPPTGRFVSRSSRRVRRPTRQPRTSPGPPRLAAPDERQKKVCPCSTRAPARGGRPRPQGCVAIRMERIEGSAWPRPRGRHR